VIGRGGLRIEVAPGRLRRARGRAKIAAPAPVLVNAQHGETAEVNLIGMRAPDALRRLEEFLDQAYLTNQSEVRVIHGVGSGALRKAVRDYLGTSPYCSGFHEAEPQAGGAGATIVQIGL
jgi:DNA mismatch repair protein MutS2